MGMMLENFLQSVIVMQPWMGGLIFIFGALVGSYLNVVIYRVPRGMSVNEPKRSFCPGCKAPIPFYRNIPLLTWIIQLGKCAGCKGRIPFRYFMVELLTALLFYFVWVCYPGWAALLGLLLVALLVAISFIDGEHYVIPTMWCWVAAPVAVVASYFTADLLTPAGMSWISWEGILPDRAGYAVFSFAGFALGYVGLVLVVLLGKVLFGRKKVVCEVPERWHLREPQTDDDQLQFVLGDEAIDWGEVFYRKTDRIELEGGQFLIDGNKVSGTSLIIRERTIEIGERTFEIEHIKAAEGNATQVVIPREAMGAGDPPLLGMIGAFLGPFAVIFTLISSCLYAIVAAVLGRVGLGKPLPFGPFLALGGLTWFFGGYKLWDLYLTTIGF